MDKLLQTEKLVQANKAIYLQLQSKISTVQGYANQYAQVQNTWINAAFSN
jgi:hypothetical protein